MQWLFRAPTADLINQSSRTNAQNKHICRKGVADNVLLCEGILSLQISDHTLQGHKARSASGYILTQLLDASANQ